MSDSIFYANDSAHVQVDAHGDVHVIFYGSSKHGYGDAQQRAILPRRVAEQMLSRLAAALAPVNSAEPPAQEEPPLTSVGEFGVISDEDWRGISDEGWRDKFGVQS